MTNRLTPERAAELMGCTAQYIRIGLQKGAFDFGRAIQMGGKRYRYYISAPKFEQETGIKVPELRRDDESK